jgi:hypothetical protein
MKVFLSHASEDKEVAEQIQLALVGAGVDVFFDAESLPVGGDYHDRIRRAVQNSDLFVFLISNHSIAKGSYCLSELGLAREKWPHPNGRVVPVRLGSVSFDLIPNYLRAVTVLEPQGNIPADVLSVVTQTRPAAVSATKLKWLPLIALPLLAATIWWNAQRPKPAPRIPQGVVVQDGMKTEQANLLTELQLELERIMTDINRERHGTKVEGLIVNQDIVPLTNFLTRLQGNKHLIPVQIYNTLYEQGLLLIDFYNAHDAATANQIGGRYVKLREQFHQQFQEAYQTPASPAPPSLRLHPGRDSVE